MQCNSSGWSDPVRGAAFGIISYDWSNAKAQWAAARPMDCEEQLQTQARLTKYANPKSNVFVYRNVVKALPWFTSVREKLDDPRYAGWFLRFDKSKAGKYHVPDCAAENASKCSVFYHDQEQTPAVPTPAAPHPDGSCSGGVCDCGDSPCGEYLFDHRNGSMLREWIVNELILGPTGVGDAAIDGLFIDDFWCSDLICKDDPSVAGCPCGDPVQGPTEEDRHSQADMGLSDEAVRDLTIGWNATMEAVQRGIVAAGGYTWSLMLGQENANAAPRMLKHDTCAAQLRAACVAGSDWQRHSILFGLTTNGSKLVQVKQDVAFFLLARGAFAWLGWGAWGMTWPFNPEPAHGESPPLPHGVPRPTEIDTDYGAPLEDVCRETSSGVFERRWSRATITLDCNAFAAAFAASPAVVESVVV